MCFYWKKFVNIKKEIERNNIIIQKYIQENKNEIDKINKEIKPVILIFFDNLDSLF